MLSKNYAEKKGITVRDSLEHICYIHNTGPRYGFCGEKIARDVRVLEL